MNPQSNEPKLRLEPKLKLKQILKPIAVTSAVLAILIVSLIYFNLGSEKKTMAGNPSNEPTRLYFKNPVLVSGVDGQVGAVYLFPSVAAGIDAKIQIMALNGGAYLSDIDHFSAGYNEAFQPFVDAPAMDTSSIDWQITFKKAGTEVDSVLKKLSVTAVDVDGDGGWLKEFVQANNVVSYSTDPSCNLQIFYDGSTLRAVSPVINVANIDTNQKQAMFQMNFENISILHYRSGAISTYGADEVRQTSLYFKSFFDAKTALPITLVGFTAAPVGTNVVKLNWITAAEINNDYYTLERSADGIHFEKIAQVKGAGNSTTRLSYDYTDQNPVDGLNYYRLTQTDYDGKYVRFPLVNVNLQMVATTLSISSIKPNPFQNYILTNYSTMASGEVNVSLMNSAGRTVKRETMSALEGNNSVQLNDLADLPDGLYFLTLSQNGQQATCKLVKN